MKTTRMNKQGETKEYNYDYISLGFNITPELHRRWLRLVAAEAHEQGHEVTRVSVFAKLIREAEERLDYPWSSSTIEEYE